MKKFIKITTILMIIMTVMTFSSCSYEENSNGGSKGGSENTSKSQSNSSYYPLEVEDSSGKKVTISEEPKKIVSLSPVSTEIVAALGKESSLVGRTTYCDYPQSISSVKTIGDITNPNIEAIADLNPDLVVSYSMIDESTVKALNDLDIKVISYTSPENFEGAYAGIEYFGKILNAVDKAKEIVGGMKETVSEVETKVKDVKVKPTVYYAVQFGEGGDYTAGGDTFIGQMIELVGGENIAKDVTGWSYSLEKLVEKNPDIVLVYNIDNQKQLFKETSGYKELDAVKNDSVYEIDANLISRSGPRLADGLKELAKIIHPEIFK